MDGILVQIQHDFLPASWLGPYSSTIVISRCPSSNSCTTALLLYCPEKHGLGAGGGHPLYKTPATMFATPFFTVGNLIIKLPEDQIGRPQAPVKATLTRCLAMDGERTIAHRGGGKEGPAVPSKRTRGSGREKVDSGANKLDLNDGLSASPKKVRSALLLEQMLYYCTTVVLFWPNRTVCWAMQSASA